MSGQQEIIDCYLSFTALHKLQLTPSLGKLYMVVLEHLLLDKLICKIYCVELPKPVGDRFSMAS